MQNGGSSDKADSQMEEDEWLVSCRCERAKSMYTLLSCLRNVGAFNNENRDLSMTQSRRRASTTSSAAIQPVTVFCYPGRMTFYVMGKSKQAQASITVQAGLFSKYNLFQQHDSRGEGDEKTNDWHSEGEFCVNLTTVLQCLNLLGMQSLERMKLSISYNLSQELFKMELTDDAGVLSTAAIPGMQPPEDDMGESLALVMRSSPIQARLMIKSDALREIIVELESVVGAKAGTVSLDSKALELAVVGDFSECLVSIPCRGDHVISVECSSSSANHAYSFPLHSLLGSLRGLEIAEETCITINNNGMMAIQHQIIDPNTGDGSPSFVDFIMCCLDDRDDSTTAEPDQQSQSQHTQDSYSQSLDTRRVSEKDDRSRALSSAMKGHESDQDIDQDDKNDDSEDDDDDDNDRMESNVASLFGSVVRDVPDINHAAEVSRTGGRRRIHSSEQRSTKLGHESDESQDLLGTDDEEEELEALDVSKRQRYDDDMDRGNTSSPEIVYGRRKVG